MRRSLLAAILVLLSVPIDGTAQQRPSAALDVSESRIALVIGNSNYKEAPLANPVNDARAVARALNESGFQVKIHTNLTQAQMRRAIREFGDELHSKQGVGLFYFAGHGVQISNRNFLIPVGADIQREYEVEDQAVDAGSVLAMMESAKARVNIVILDACRNNPFIRNFRSAVNGLAPMQAPAGTLVAFATAPGQTAIDGAGQYGLYTEHLVENLSIPGLKIEDVFKNVRLGVQRASGGRQVPWENTSLTGDFYFRVKVTVEIDDAARRRAEREDIDLAVRQALAQRDEEAARRKAQQDEIERAVLAALRKREEEQAVAQAARAEREIQSAREAIERLNRELAELRTARDAAPAARQAALPPASVTPDVAAPVSKPIVSPPAQVALAAPTTRARPVVHVGGKVERPDIRVGDQWKYQVTDLFTNIKSTTVFEVTTVAENRIYTRSVQSSLATFDLATAVGVVDVWDRDWNLLRQGAVEYTPFYPFLQFPLESGKKWSGTVRYDVGVGINMQHRVTAEVVGWERITVPAGTFDAIKITLQGYMHVTGIQPGSGTIGDAYWYSPAVQQLVRREHQHRTSQSAFTSGGSGAAVNQRFERWELVEYKPN